LGTRHTHWSEKSALLVVEQQTKATRNFKSKVALSPPFGYNGAAPQAIERASRIFFGFPKILNMYPQIPRNRTLTGRFDHVNIDSQLCLSRSLDAPSRPLDPNPNPVPTSSIPFVETEHGRLRRIQRGIDKKDLQRARKYGTRVPGRVRPDGSCTSKYTYNDIVYIVNDATAEEITSYAVPLTLEPVPLPESAEVIHTLTRDKLLSKPSSWTSNTVLVVDVSGSMREGDVWGTRDRLSAIWVSVALDFLAHRLECGAAKTTDMISIVTLEENPKHVALYEPTTWTLYNKIVDIYKNKTVRACGHGPVGCSIQSFDQYIQ
jgi:hypothetical protein